MRRAILVFLSCLSGCHAGSSTQLPPRPELPNARGGGLTTNIARADYAGSSACSDCHAQIYERWAASPMRNMTRDAKTAKIRAPFDGATLHVGADTATMVMDGADRVVRVTTKTGTQRWQVTKVVGGRYREDFVGVADGESVEHVLPATYVFATRSWRYKGYSVMVKERPGMSVRGQWSHECIGCHNTLPLSTMLYDELYGPKLPPYQGKLSDRVLPRSKQWGVVARDGTGLAALLTSEIQFLGVKPPDERSLAALLPAAATASEDRLDGAHLVELGIGCEACHNGARLHAENPELKPAYEAKSPLLAITPPQGQRGTRAQWINHTCAKCHTVLFTRYPWTWEGGLRSPRQARPEDPNAKSGDHEPGGSSISSGEGRDYQLGGCASQMACTTCHDPHTADPQAKLDALATPAGDATCTAGCHPQFAKPDTLENHAHHKTVSCVACHMPRKNMGLDYGLNRYHRIGAATNPRRVEGDRPLECALCHADKSVEALVSTMEAWYGKTFDRDKLRALYGADLNVNVMRATLERGKPHEQAVALTVLGELKDKTAVAAVAAQLAHDYPLVRYYAQRALQNITGDPVAIDVGGAASDVRAATTSWLKSHH